MSSARSGNAAASHGQGQNGDRQANAIIMLYVSVNFIYVLSFIILIIVGYCGHLGSIKSFNLHVEKPIHPSIPLPLKTHLRASCPSPKFPIPIQLPKNPIDYLERKASSFEERSISIAIESKSSFSASSKSSLPISKPKIGEQSSRAQKLKQHEIHNRKKTAKIQITHFHLVLLWSSGFCNFEDKCWPEIEENKFYVHGLWPTGDNGRHKLFCELPNELDSEEEPSRTLGPAMVQLLHQRYPSFVRYANPPNQYECSPVFWRNEYRKHGSCAREVGIDLIPYFQRISELSQLGLEGHFADMLNAETTTHSMEDFQAALHTIIGEKRFWLSCLKDTTRLVEIMLCLSIDTIEFISCPPYDRTFSCPLDNVVTFYHGWSYVQN